MTTDPSPPSGSDIAIRAIIAALPTFPRESLSIIYQGVRDRQAHKAEMTLQEVVEVTGENRLISRLADDPELEALFIEGMEAAARTGLEVKRRLLACVVAQAVNDDATIDESELKVFALRDLDPPSIRALHRIRVAEDMVAKEVTAAVESEPPELSEGDTLGHYQERVVALRMIDTVWRQPAPVLATLTRTGVLEQAKEAFASLSRARKVSAFGRSLLDDLQGVDAPQDVERPGRPDS